MHEACILPPPAAHWPHWVPASLSTQAPVCSLDDLSVGHSGPALAPSWAEQELPIFPRLRAFHPLRGPPWGKVGMKMSIAPLAPRVGWLIWELVALIACW